MTHLENIKKLFSKNFVESPLLESFEVGKIYLSSGKLVACDPVITNDMKPFTTEFPKGDFSVLLHKERESNCVAYAEIIFSNAAISEWEMAVTEGQNVKDLADEEIFGYPVESGMGCLMDADTQNSLNELENRLYHSKGADFMGIYEEFFHEYFFDEKGAIDQYAFLKPADEHPGTIFAFETGYGEGFYASYIAYDKDHKPVKIITEFIEIS
ncbi:DUF4241 domain-containing protein [Chryseobacterium carnipullorum]|uniref:DUF4241 domain-containing protein n=1 Tax=Chryseobacterium carnipullorum TaxID=1124835 RepID=A0A1M7KHD2_CHRCU|nr:DUF4241 domain-containing protein [Chryseobacterium carnipullorum]MDN5422832.1 DUF4241 domain-containing protein [Chryseobacterium sp.]AZA48802.1 DUF4241 domain-containing protein [Chryseobacterium carnipullorum]AZA63713.1 DUF4241 domain-containing protein [Chryseobacterium carnipullorum]MDN5475773.1 DUF4241 domain-containing protein [Chryseobacterium sp.]SHM64723.1 Protein of unknown function [Chryseobacterium carnipullorum]